MTTAAQFWARIMPSGLTAEAEVVQFWADMRECRCGQRPATVVPVGGGSRRRRRPFKAPALPPRINARLEADIDDELVTIMAAAILPH